MHTIVQHSAWVANGDPQFERGLESRSVTPAQAKKVVAAGGEIFATYGEAENAAEEHMYPPGHDGLIPAAAGSFADLTIEGARVYVPKKEG